MSHGWNYYCGEGVIVTGQGAGGQLDEAAGAGSALRADAMLVA